MSDPETPVPPPACWIWFRDDESMDVFARARRKVTLDAAPEKATLHITATGHYRLWVNGAFAGRGPSRPTLGMKRYDVLDIGPLLREGENVLAVHLVHYGYHTAHCLESPPGFWCELDMDMGGENRLRVESDTEWRFSHDAAYDRNAGRRNQCYGIIEIYDARREEDWIAGDFDDSSWAPADVSRPPLGSPLPKGR